MTFSSVVFILLVLSALCFIAASVSEPEKRWKWQIPGLGFLCYALLIIAVYSGAWIGVNLL